MQFFLDTANVELIKQFVDWGVVDGVTTNPTLIAKEGIDLEKRIKEIAAVVDGPISSEVIATDSEGMIAEGRKYAKWHENVYVKLPMTAEGMKALHVLSKEGINTNVTLVFSANQALIAAKAGATLVSPFIGRLDDIGIDGMGLIEDIVEIYERYGYMTEVLAASIRHTEHVHQAAQAGADICTMPPKVLEKMIHHPLTDHGLEKFLADWETMKIK
jgi:transaldolase